MLRVACFVTPHGYGHAARASAIMAALHEQLPGAAFDIYTHVPRAFFEQSLDGPFDYHPLLSDIGLVQHDALHEDVPETIRRLDALLPFDPEHIQRVATRLRERETALVICDIAPMGILIAGEAGLPSVLVENFTWDWIYEAYSESDPLIVPHAAYLAACFSRADHHIQTNPVCNPANVDLVTPPVARKSRTASGHVRKQLGIVPGQRMVLVSMGGVPEQHDFLDTLHEETSVDFVLPTGVAEMSRNGNVIELPHSSEFYHPDLVGAADAVIGKIGYSTISEVFHAGVPFGYIGRPRFREAPPLADFVSRQIPSVPISPDQVRSGAWVSERLPLLLGLQKQEPPSPNGADRIAAFIAECIL